MNKARGVHDGRGRPRLVVSVIEDITERKRSELAQRLLSRTGEVLASSLDYEQTLQEVAGLAVPELADWCGVSMPDRHGVIRQVAVVHSDPAKVEFARELRPPLPEPRQRRGRLGAGPARRAVAADPRDPRRAARAGGRGSRAARAAPQPRHALGGDGADGRRDAGRRSASSRSSTPSRAACSPRPTSSCSRRSGGAPASRSRTPASTRSARRSRARSSARCCRPRCRRSPASRSPRCTGRRGGRTGSAATSTTRSRCRDGWMVVVGDVAGRGAPAASLTAYSRHVLRTAAQLHDDPLDAIAVPQPPALRPARPGAVHGLLRAAARSAARDAEATVVCAGHPLPVRDPRRRRARSRSGSFGHDARRVGGRRVPAHDDDARAPASCSCSTPTA